jgi:hypothetical protein
MYLYSGPSYAKINAPLIHAFSSLSYVTSTHVPVNSKEPNAKATTPAASMLSRKSNSNQVHHSSDVSEKYTFSVRFVAHGSARMESKCINDQEGLQNPLNGMNR